MALLILLSLFLIICPKVPKLSFTIRISEHESAQLYILALDDDYTMALKYFPKPLPHLVVHTIP